MSRMNEISVSKVTVILENLLLKEKGETLAITKEMDIRTEFQLDDIDITELVMELEREFGTSVNDELIALMTESPEKITPIVLTKLVNENLIKKINAVLI